MALTTVAQDVENLSSKFGLRAELAMIDRAWDVEMGVFKKWVRLVAIDHGTLIVEADSHAAMQDVLLRRKELLRKMNKHLVSAPLNNMIVRLAQNNGH